MITALLLSLAVAGGGEAPDVDALHRATWYGAACSSPYLGRLDTCTPYLSEDDGGRGGELTLYAAAGWYRWGMAPAVALITSLDTGRRVFIVVRDYCEACHDGRAVLDLSPVAFCQLWRDGACDPLTLGRGVANVVVRYFGAR